PRERIRAVLYWMTFLDNTVQYQWFIEIARAFLNYQSERLSLADCTWLCDTAERLMASPDWEEQVLRRSHIEKVFLTNDFDDPLEDFDAGRYVPCLRTDDLVFNLHDPKIRDRLQKSTNVEVGDAASLRRALASRFEHFKRRGAGACAISLPPDFAPEPVADSLLSAKLAGAGSAEERTQCSYGVFWMLAELCREYRLPFD